MDLCPHGVMISTGGWTREADPKSKYYGLWVHGDPKCRKPKHVPLTQDEIARGYELL